MNIRPPKTSRQHSGYINIGNRQSAFTLLEMLIVVAILSTLAFGAVSLIDESDEHVRFDNNKTRLIKLREGIVGDPSALLNRPPIIQGYLADMGCLPDSIYELVNQGTQPSWTYDSTANQWAGWRGPYLHTLEETLGTKIFTDGWGNTGDTNNFGWRFDVNQALGTILAQSYGADGQPGGADYDSDYPDSSYLIHPYEALVEIAHWKVTVYLYNPDSSSGDDDEGDDDEGDDEGDDDEGDDDEGDDDEGDDDEGDDDDGLVTICHKPGTPAEQTMTIPSSALGGHLGHGDFLGSCEEGDDDEGDDDEGDDDEGDSPGDALPLAETTVRLRLFYPEDGSLTWPDTWLATSGERDSASYLSLAVTIAAGLVPDGEMFEVEFDFGGTSKLIPQGIRSMALVEDETGNFFGDSTQSADSLTLLPKMQLQPLSVSWALE